MRLKKDEERFYLIMSLAVFLVGLTLILVICRIGEAEALPSPDSTRFIALNGDLALTGAEKDVRVAECVRVDVRGYDADGAWAELTLHQIPPGITDAAIYDGWHLIHAQWTQTGENTLRLHFRAGDLKKLDGSVGLYLVILAERTGE